MKTLGLLLATIFVVVIADAQIQSDCSPSPALVKLYRSDAADMALERMYGLRVGDTALIEIPSIYQDTFVAALAAICNLDAQYEADSVFKSYCVHRMTQYYFVPQALSVKVDTAYAWAKQWYLGQKVSGNLALDDFMRLHDVAITNYRIIPGASEILNNIATLSAQRPINMQAFADSLRRFKGVVWCDFPQLYGSGNNIAFSVDSLLHLTFKAGWGDCPLGCTSFKIWKYSVDPAACAVRLDTVYFGGDREPHRLPHCNLWPAAVAGPKSQLAFTIVPNPASGQLQIAGSLSAIDSYCIVDLLGRTQIQSRYNSNAIDISTLVPGVYSLLITTSEGVRHLVKFVRQ